MARNGVAKVYWEEVPMEVEEEFEDLPPETVDVLAAEDDVKKVDAELAQDTGLMSGVILRTKIKKQVKVTALAPEEFGVTAKSKSMEDAVNGGVVWHRERKSKSQLRKMGVSEAQIAEMSRADAGIEWEQEPEVLARFESLDDNIVRDSVIQEQGEKVWVYEVYSMLDIEGKDTQELWKVTMAGRVLIDKEKVECLPFVVFTPIPRQHSFYGTNFGELVVHDQNVNTVLTRSIVDHTVMTNVPRYTVLNGALNNPRELMDNRIGGLVNVNRPDSVLPLPQAPLNPFSFQTIQLIGQQKEMKTGTSNLSKGLDRDAISKQNSRDMVQDLVALSQQRQKVMARQFGEFVKELFILIYRVVLENEDREDIVEVAGNFVEVNPTTWKERKDFTVDLTVGYGEKERKAQQWAQIDAMLSERAPDQYLPQNRSAVIGKVLEGMGVKDVQTYLTPAEQIPPPQPDPFAMKEMELREREVAIKEQQAQISMMEMQIKAQEAGVKLELQQAKQAADFALASDAQDMKERETMNRIAISQREMAVVEKSEGENRTAIASPNS